MQSTRMMQGKLTRLQYGTFGIGFVKPLYSNLARRIDAIFDDIASLKKLPPDVATAVKFSRTAFRIYIGQRYPGCHMIVGPKCEIS